MIMIIIKDKNETVEQTITDVYYVVLSLFFSFFLNSLCGIISLINLLKIE